MKKILIGYISNTKGSGLDNYIFQLVDVLKREEVQIDLLSSAIDEELKEKYKQDPNVRLLPINRVPQPHKRYKQIKNYINENQYDIAYFNISEAFDCFGNLASYGRVPVTITHSHASGNDNQNRIKRYISKIAHIIGRPILNQHTNYRFACSDIAAKWLFGKNKQYRVIRNTINSKKFIFNNANRVEIRKNLNLSDDDIVLGFVGNLTYSKNPFSLIALVKELKRKLPKTKLLMIGDGPLKDEIIKTIKEESLENNIYVLGKKFDVEKYYSAMDLFILPSNFEGYGIVGVEAQVNGLPCLFSKNVPNSLSFSNKAKFYDPRNLKEGAEKVVQLLKGGRNHRLSFNSNIIYDIEDQKSEFIDMFINDKF